MQRPIIVLGLICLTLSVFAACGPSEQELAAQKDQENRQKLEELQQQHEALGQRRAQLEAARTRLADLAAEDGAPEEGAAESAEEGGEAEGAEPEMTPEELEAEVQRLEGEIKEDAQAFYDAVSNFINEDVPIYQGEPMSDIQKTAVRMKSEEEIVIAREHIEEGGNFTQAISIYRQALIADPDNPELQAALEEAESLRFMTEERFSQVRRGMTEDEVRELLGRPYHQNIRRYEEQGVTAWYYPKDEQKAAAAVWFRPRQGELQVYRTDFNASAGQSGDEGDG